MGWYFALVLLLGTVCTSIVLGLPVIFAFFAASILGTFILVNGDIGLVLMSLEFHIAIKFTLATICLFLWMGVGEESSPATIVGGVIIFLAIITYGILNIKSFEIHSA